MSKPVRITRVAELQIDEIDAWWRANREKALDRFEEELSSAFEMLAATPGIGQKYPHPEASVRRLLLRTTKNHVYYVEKDDCVLVVAVWGAVRGSGPDLTGIR